MEYNYEKNTPEASVTYMRTHNGPNSFRVYYKNGACIRFTPSVNAIRDWCYQMVDKYGSEADKDNDEYRKYIAKHGFGPEAHEEPNDNTKMIT